MVRWVVGSILRGVNPSSYFSFHPVLHDWYDNNYDDEEEDDNNNNNNNNNNRNNNGDIFQLI